MKEPLWTRGPADPMLTANLYCSGRIDEVIREVAAPFWNDLAQADPERSCRLWLLRHRRCGEHLKFRLHGPEPLETLMRRQLEDKAQAYLDSHAPSKDSPRPTSSFTAPPIDLEDETDVEHPDGTFLWTHYRRSHVTFGGSPFLEDDTFAGLFAHALSRSCEKVLAVWGSMAAREISFGQRQTALWNQVIPGLAALGLPASKRTDFLIYHRDWMVRFPLARSGEPETLGDRMGQVLRHFEQRADGMDPVLAQLRAFAHQQWESNEVSYEDPLTEAWVRSVADLHQYIAPTCRERGPDPQVDPFAGDLTFVPLLKLFHSATNPLGLNLLEEGFAYHLLLRATAETAAAEEPGEEAHRPR